MTALIPHSTTPCAAVRSIAVQVEARQHQLILKYRLEGEVTGLRIPATTQPARRDGLWKHSCFEAFLAPPGREDYIELNFSPSGEWAAYAFRRYREAAPEIAVPPPRIETNRTASTLELTATLVMDDWFPSHNAALALSAVIENAQGVCSYWALRHPAAKPDFHHREGFALTLKLD